MISRTFSGVDLYEQAQHHRVQRDRLARARRARDQQVRHARKVGAHRLAADVLAERERQRRLQLVVGLRLHDLAERDDLANLVRNLEADVRLARNDLDDAHAHGRERSREVLREIADLAALHARGGLELEARDDRARDARPRPRPRRRNR